MVCQRCGKELVNGSRCPFCGYDNAESPVREMSPQERKFYRGITIDANPQNSYRERAGGNYRASGSSFAVKFLNALIRGNLLARIIATVLVLAISAVMFFIAVPVIFFVLMVGVALYIFSRR